jgi:methionyl-tRNA formyltransferase
LAGKGQSTKFIYNGLINNFDITDVILENPISKKKLIKGRIKKLGLPKVVNQLLFQSLIPRILKASSSKRIETLKNDLNLDSLPIPKQKLNYVNSVNDNSCKELLENLSPDIVIVNGTRIISERILKSIDGIFINSHVGITPEYRGVHGAYWALFNKDKENCGVTIHLVDTGIDTGSILKQEKIVITGKDNFVTYPLYQYGLAISLLNQVITEVKMDTFKPFKKENSTSKLYYHPTFTGYIYNRIFKNIK